MIFARPHLYVYAIGGTQPFASVDTLNALYALALVLHPGGYTVTREDRHYALITVHVMGEPVLTMGPPPLL